MTERLYYFDSYRTEFESPVSAVHADGLVVELARTAFYPTSGGQPHDVGYLNGIPVHDVTETSSGEVLHHLAAPLPAVPMVRGAINWDRRLDHMRQHTGQHLLSAVMAEEFGLTTVSFHLGEDYATIDVEPQSVSPETLSRIQEAANRRLLENVPVQISFENAAIAQSLRKPSERSGLIRIITIAGLDRSACGGTHVRETGEIGLVVLGRTEKIRQALRIEFYCGPRAIAYLQRRAQTAESDLVQIREKLAEADKLRRRALLELAEIEGRAQYQSLAHAQPIVWRAEVPEIGETVRTRANAFLNGPGALVLLYVPATGALLFGAHASTGVDCGQRFKALLQRYSGKGGGNARLVQGAIADSENLEAALAFLLADDA
jgi:alanyl-tRNA synthetase